MVDMPYFMSDERWFEFDFDKRIFVLTEEAPAEAQKSYEEYLNQKGWPNQPFFYAMKGNEYAAYSQRGWYRHPLYYQSHYKAD